jgi:hypothetical protein
LLLARGIIYQIVAIARGTIFYAIAIARVTINFTLGLARSHYSSEPGQKLAGGLTS